MSRVLLFHWDPREAEEHAAKLRVAGHSVQVFSKETGSTALGRIRTDPPDVFVVDLSRRPSQGRDLGVWLRQQKSTRSVPLVFVEADPVKTDRVRELLPDAAFTSWRRIRGVIRSVARAAAHPSPGRPVVPGTMAAYSGTPLPKKLGVRAGSTVALIGAPSAFDPGPLPEGASLFRRAGPGRDIVLLFVKSAAELSRRFDTAARSVAEGGRLWIVWPKKTSALAGDLGGNEVRRFGMDAGWVDYKIAAIDEDWSGLCFSRRRAKLPVRSARARKAGPPRARRRRDRGG
jgi:CheY-like chemotaxis protein